MFVRRKEFEELKSNFERLRSNVGKLNQQLETNTSYGKRHSKAIENLEEQTGISQDHFLTLYFGTPDIKPFNLKEKVDAILEYLGLTERITEPNKLVAATKKTKETK